MTKHEHDYQVCGEEGETLCRVCSLPPVSRRSGPATSKQAEAQIGDIRRSQIKEIVAFLRREAAEGHTSSFDFSSVAHYCYLTHEQAKKRLTDCKNLGLAYQEGTVKVNGFQRGLWHATRDGQLPLRPKTKTRHCPGCNCKEANDE